MSGQYKLVKTKLASGRQLLGYELNSHLLLVPLRILPDIDYLNAVEDALKDLEKLSELKLFSNTNVQCFLKLNKSRFEKIPWWAPVRTFTDIVGRTLVLLQIEPDRINFYSSL